MITDYERHLDYEFLPEDRLIVFTRHMLSIIKEKSKTEAAIERVKAKIASHCWGYGDQEKGEKLLISLAEEVKKYDDSISLIQRSTRQLPHRFFLKVSFLKASDSLNMASFSQEEQTP